MERTHCQRHSSCLWFQMFGVEAYSFLPDDQRDRCNFARQRQASHLRPHPFGNESSIELLERASLGGGEGRGTLEQVLEIVIMIAVEPAKRYLLLRSL